MSSLCSNLFFNSIVRPLISLVSIIASVCSPPIRDKEELLQTTTIEESQKASPGGLFDLLPEDTILCNILTRMEFKDLCKCLLVSKGFALLIHRVDNVTLNLSMKPNEDENKEHCYPRILHEILCSKTKEEIPGIIQESFIQNLSFICRSLEKFKDLKSIHVKFDTPIQDCDYSPFRWKLLCRSHGSKVRHLVSVLPAAIYKTRASKSKTNNGGDDPSIVFVEKSSKRFLKESWGKEQVSYYAEWHVVLFMLLKCHDSLDSLSIASSNANDDQVFVLKDEKLVEWRNILLFKEFSNKILPKNYCKMAWGHMVPLSDSGYVMFGVLLMVFGSHIDYSYFDLSIEYEDAITGIYTGEKELLSEVVADMVKSVFNEN